jgi:hypothetical protein
VIVGASTPMECFTFLQVLPYLDSLVTSLSPERGRKAKGGL